MKIRAMENLTLRHLYPVLLSDFLWFLFSAGGMGLGGGGGSGGGEVRKEGDAIIRVTNTETTSLVILPTCTQSKDPMT
jgi:hypothetical protein